MTIEFIEIDWAGRAVRIEHAWLAPERAAAPLVVFLHEGLGSLSTWRDFPQRLCDAALCRGLVYSRPGYGRSTPRAPEGPQGRAAPSPPPVGVKETWDGPAFPCEAAWGLDFLHRQALEVLPALLAALQVTERPWLFGHSDGGSIALLHAAHRPAQTAGAIVLAPHIRVEELSVAGVEEARTAFETSDLRERLARHHDDPESAFWGWNRIWLHPPIRQWSIEAEITAIACPLLAVQGLDDEYGTLEQIRGIARRVPQARLLELADCGHAPQRDQPEALLAAAAAFIGVHCRDTSA